MSLLDLTKNLTSTTNYSNITTTNLSSVSSSVLGTNTSLSKIIPVSIPLSPSDLSIQSICNVGSSMSSIVSDPSSAMSSITSQGSIIYGKLTDVDTYTNAASAAMENVKIALSNIENAISTNMSILSSISPGETLTAAQQRARDFINDQLSNATNYLEAAKLAVTEAGSSILSSLSLAVTSATDKLASISDSISSSLSGISSGTNPICIQNKLSTVSDFSQMGLPTPPSLPFIPMKPPVIPVVFDSPKLPIVNI